MVKGGGGGVQSLLSFLFPTVTEVSTRYLKVSEGKTSVTILL